MDKKSPVYKWFFLPTESLGMVFCLAAAPFLSTRKNIAIWLIILGMVIIAILFLLNRKRKPMGEKLTSADSDSITRTLSIPSGISRTYSFSFLNECGKRAQQQDSCSFSDYTNAQLVKRQGFLAIVADGMGGMKNGKEVSQQTVNQFLRDFANYSMSGDIPEQLLASALAVNEAVFSRDQMESGSTLVSVLIFQDKVYWISIGDSAIYLFRENRLYQVNREHNHLNELFLEYLYQQISVDEVVKNPQRNGLTSNIGRNKLNEVDQNFIPLNILPGDKLLLCSDGISGCLSESELLAALQLDTPEACCEQLNQSVIRRNNPRQDNYTAEVIFCK